MLCGRLDGRGWEFGGEWTHVYVLLSPFAVHLKLLIGYTQTVNWLYSNTKLKEKSLAEILVCDCEVVAPDHAKR